MKALSLGLLLLLLGSNALAQSSLQIEKLQRQKLADASTEVGYSSLIEGVVSDPALTVFVFVYQPHRKTWRIFPATIMEEAGVYRWRALCHFGKVDGTGVGASYSIKALAFNKDQLTSGLPKTLSPSVLKSNAIVLKRTR